ncbi:methyl-accepting chemotaxis protein [Noviherbaspirillum saxi]|uniref:HAMP domain-containing protein n=1 Tax=Noviherbaspirillum saxi TaxID=2320863 RepID=A0A3A3FIF5_9BURK|nr:methyl-accepting chemotaxis protein [Noviherbaspirillum saxi]RJF95044.1 HAMP domain-containing protein [Noviherbaspirillum saxi]
MKILNLKIGKRLAIGFGLIIALMIMTTVIGDSQIGRLHDSINLVVKDRYPNTVVGNVIQIEVNKTGLNMRDILLLTDEEKIIKLLASIDDSTRIIAENFGKLEKAIESNEGKRHLKAALDARASYAVVRDEFLKAFKDGQKDRAKEILHTSFVQPQVNYFIALDGMIAYQGTLMDDAGKAAESDANSAQLILNILAVVAAILSIIIWVRVSRSITKPLHEAVDVAERVANGDLTTVVNVNSKDETGQLMAALKAMNESLVRIVGQVRQGTDTIVTASSEIANGNADLSSRTESQASALEQTASSMEELTSTVRQNAEHAKQANQLVINASEQAIKGGQVVDSVVSTMGSIKDSSRKVVEIIAVIDSIAFQTNILALNAAVEAARAGEQGRGFAVVASEVRTLAQRSAAAAKEIKSLINDSVEKVDAGGALVDEAGRTMQEIVNSVKHVADIMSEITAASNEQSSGIEEVNGAIGHMDEMTQQNAALVEQAAAAAASMQEQAANLVQVVSVFNTGTAIAVAAPVALRAPAPMPVRAGNRARIAAPAPQRGGDEWEEF